MNNDWDLMRAGRSEEAIAMMRQQVLNGRMSATDAINLCAGLMWVRDYEAVCRHCADSLKFDPKPKEILHAFSGAASWCLGDCLQAMATWEEGLDCEYSWSFVPMYNGLLMYFGTAVQPACGDVNQIREMIRRLIRKSSKTHWMTRLALYAIGDLDLPQDENADNPQQEALRKTLSKRNPFWEGVRQLAKGNREDFVRVMQSISQLTWDDFDRNRSAFIDKIWGPEFFLARYEAERLK